MQNLSQTQIRRILITGANKGIGYAIVERLLDSSNAYNIILTSRDPKLGQEALKKLQAKKYQPSTTLTYQQLDVNDEKSVQGLIAWLEKSGDKIDVLVNNAGVNLKHADLEQSKKTIETNYLSLVNLTEKLRPYLTEDAKVISISSGLGALSCQSSSLRKQLQVSPLNEEDLQKIQLNLETYYKDFRSYHPIVEASYCASKALLNAYTRWVLPNKLGSNQQCYSVAPGWCRTDMGGEEASLPVEAGADTPVYLIELPFVKNEKINGKVLENRKVISF